MSIKIQLKQKRQMASRRGGAPCASYLLSLVLGPMLFIELAAQPATNIEYEFSASTYSNIVRDQVKPLVESYKPDSDPYAYELDNWLRASDFDGNHHWAKEADQRLNWLPDEVFYDLRETGCISTVRDQGPCGCCYAFASIAIMEFIYCQRFGEPIQLSEQYMVDCGNAYVNGLEGCNGGSSQAAAEFLLNFGLELGERYRYIGALAECPYGEQTNLQETGYFRSDIDQVLEVDIEYWPENLATGPMLVSVAMTDDFYAYTGGVGGWGCNKAGQKHAMVVIGHGRQNNTEYWLLRNSHSTGWGEGGYYKLAKDADCVQPRVGVKFGTRDGRHYDFKFAKNELNDNEIVAARKTRPQTARADQHNKLSLASQ